MINRDINLTSYTVLQQQSVASGIPDGVNIIDAPKFWDRGRKGENITIAVIDTGCDITHINLKDRIVGVRKYEYCNRLCWTWNSCCRNYCRK